MERLAAVAVQCCWLRRVDNFQTYHADAIHDVPDKSNELSNKDKEAFKQEATRLIKFFEDEEANCYTPLS